VIGTKDENIDAIVAESGGGAATPTKAPEKIVAQPQEGASSAPKTPQQSQGEASTPPPQKAPGGAPAPSAPRVAAASTTTSPAAAAGNGGGRPRSSPLARRLATERGLDISSMQGSGPGGRIIRRDIEAAATASPAAGGARPIAPATGPRSDADYEDVALTQIRKTIARRLAESIGPIPTFYLTAEFDLSRVVEMREAMLELGEEFKVSINDILLKAVATALAQHPEVNAHWLGDKIRQHYRVHLGMAVATND